MKTLNEIKKQVIEMGGNEWSKNNMERVYISCGVLNKLREEEGLRGDLTLGERNNKIFLDVKTGNIMRSYKNKKPTLELELN